MSPIYTYECKKEGKKFQKLFVTFWDAAPNEDYTDCPSCGERANRLLDAPATKFVGTGFYENDYKPKAPNTPASVESTG